MDASSNTATAGKGLAKSPGALAGIKVVDLTRVLGGPYCTMILSDHGAEVIKIEPPQGDEVRDWGPPFHDGDASYFIGINRNKHAISLDIGKPAGKEVLLRLLEGADVLTENFKPGSMEKWGLGYHEVLSRRFPGLIHCRISGFGGDGPLGGLPGYDAILQAMTGLMSVNGDANTGPMRLGTAIVDMGTGLYSAIGILMALHERKQSGRGQYLDMTLYDCGMALLHPQAANYFLNGKRPAGTGNPHPNLVPYDKYPTRTCEIFIASGNNGQFRKLCELIGRPELADDPRFANNGERNVNRDALGRAGRGVCRAGRLRTRRPADPQRRARRAGDAGRRGDRRAAYRASRDGHRAGSVQGPRHADQAVAHAGRHASSAAALRPGRCGGAGATWLFGSRDRRVAARRRAAQQTANLNRHRK